MPAPPVATTRSHWLISSALASIVGFSIPIIRSSGAPNFLSASLILFIISVLVFFVLGCGANIIAFPPMIALIAFITGVASGFVHGTRAPITPTGFAILIRPFALSLSTIPTVLASATSLTTPLIFFWSFPYLL